MPTYGKGECFYGLRKECILGDKGVEVNPIYCLTCALLKLAEVLEEDARARRACLEKRLREELKESGN